MSCEQWFTKSRIDRNLTRVPLHNPKEHNTAPGDENPIVLVIESPPSCGYENFVTAMEVFSRFLFA